LYNLFLRFAPLQKQEKTKENKTKYFFLFFSIFFCFSKGRLRL